MYPTPNRLNTLASGLWETHTPHRVRGWLEVGHRMTVVQLRENGLLVHSPVELDPRLAQELEQIGEVRYVVAPNLFHDLFFDGWIRAYPAARFLKVPGRNRKLEQGPFETLAPGTKIPGIDEVLQVLQVGGMPRVNEFVYLHRSSRTLIVADLIFNMTGESPRATRWCLQATGVYGKPGVSRLFRWMIRDREAFQASMRKLLGWDFDRLVMGHGEIVTVGGKDVLRQAMSRIGIG